MATGTQEFTQPGKLNFPPDGHCHDITLGGTHAGVTLRFEASLNGDHWLPVATYNCTRSDLDTGIIALTPNELRCLKTYPSPRHLRLNVLTVGSGKLTVSYKVSPVTTPDVTPPRQAADGYYTKLIPPGTASPGDVLVKSAPGYLCRAVVLHTTAYAEPLLFYDNDQVSSGVVIAAVKLGLSLGDYVDIRMPARRGIVAATILGTPRVTVSYY